MKVDPSILARERINIYNRDFCAHFLVPLNRCRRAQPMHLSLPWSCHEELYAYERCQHIEWVAACCAFVLCLPFHPLSSPSPQTLD